MHVSLIFKLVGHSFEILGSLGLAYELLQGYPRRNRKEIAEKQLTQLLAFLKEAKANVDRLKDTYPDPEKAKRDLDDQWKENIAKLKGEITKCGPGFELLSFLLGWLGAGVLILGFALQLVAELMETA